MLSCWLIHPEDRPSFEQLVIMLDDLLGAAPIPQTAAVPAQSEGEYVGGQYSSSLG